MAKRRARPQSAGNYVFFVSGTVTFMLLLGLFMSYNHTYHIEPLVPGGQQATVTMYPGLKYLKPTQVEYFVVAVNGGTGPFSVELFNITGNKPFAYNVIIPSPGATNTISFVATRTGTFTYNIIVTDTGVTPSYNFNSTASTINVSFSGAPPPTSIAPSSSVATTAATTTVANTIAAAGIVTTIPSNPNAGALELNNVYVFTIIGFAALIIIVIYLVLGPQQPKTKQGQPQQLQIVFLNKARDRLFESLGLKAPGKSAGKART